MADSPEHRTSENGRNVCNLTDVREVLQYINEEIKKAITSFIAPIFKLCRGSFVPTLGKHAANIVKVQKAAARWPPT